MAARACGLVGLEPARVSSIQLAIVIRKLIPLKWGSNEFSCCVQVAEILKDRLSWFRDCRTVDVLNVMSTGNGGTIELLYMQVLLI